MTRLFYLISILVLSPHTVVSHDSDYDAITTTPSGSYERIKSKAQEALYHGTRRRDIDFIQVKKRHMYYGTKLFEDRWTPGFEFLNSSEFFEQEGNTPRSPAQVVRDKEKFLAEHPDYKNEKVQCYEELMRDKNVFLDDYDVVKYRKMVRDENLGVTVDWNRFRRYTNTTIPPEDSLSNELHRIHMEMFRTKDPLTQLEDHIRRKAEQYRDQKRRENLTRHNEDKAVSYRYVRRPKPNCTYLYGKADIIDSGEYIKQLIDRRPRDPENSEDPDFIKFCLNRGYSLGFHAATTLRLRRNFTIPFFNLNRRKVLDLLKSSEIDLEDNPEQDLDHTIDEDAIRAQYSNEVDALRRLKALEAKRVDKLMKQVNKLKHKLKSTTTEKPVWMDHPLFLNRMFQHKAIVDRCMGENCTMVPTTIDFHMLYEMHRNTRTTDVSLLSREILRGQDTLQASGFEKYLHFMRQQRNNSALCGQDILDEELRARDPKVFQFVHNNVEYTINNSREVMDIFRDYEENQARERSSSEMNHTTELSIWDHWETPGSTTEDPEKLKMEVLYKEPASYSEDSHPWHNTSDEVDLLWKKHKKEASPDYTYDETAFPMVTRSSPRSTTHRPPPWEVFLAKMATIDRLDRRISDATTPEYEEQHARVLEYAAPGSQMVRVHEIGFRSHEDGPDTDFDERNLVDELRYDEAKKAQFAAASNVVHLDGSHGKSYMDLDPEEAIAERLPCRPSPVLKWRAITRRTQPSTPEPPRTKAAWFVKSSQRYHQRLEDRKRWEIEKLHRTKKPNISTRLPVGKLHEDDLYYDEAAMPVFDVLRAREQLEGTTSSYEVGTFENLPYVEKKNVLRASIKRQRALNEYWSRKFSVTTLHPPTRRTFNFHKVSSARYYWGAMHHTFVVHYMNSSEAYEDDKQNFYNKLGLNRSKKPKTTLTTTQSGKEKKTKTKKTKAPTTTGVTKSTTSFPIPLNGSYEEWHRWNQDLKEENNIISWYSDTSERVWAHQRNRSLRTRRPIERSGVFYESGSRDYPVNCSLSLETDVPPPAAQWKQFEKWQRDRFTRLDLTCESLEEPPYEKLPFDMRTTLDSRAHQITLYPRVTSPRVFADSSEEWEKLNLAIPRRTRPPRNATRRERRSVHREKPETALAPSILGEAHIEGILHFRKLYSGGLTVGQSRDVPFRPKYSAGVGKSPDQMIGTAVQNEGGSLVECNLEQATGGAPFRRAYSGGRIAVDEDVQIGGTTTDAPIDSSETIKPNQADKDSSKPTLLNLKRLVNYLEKLNQKSLPEMAKEQVVVDNLKQLFAFLESEHVKLVGKKNSVRKCEEQSYGRTKLDRMRDTVRSAAHRASRIEFKNNIMDMPAMKELKNQLSSDTNVLNNDVDSTERKLVRKLTMKNMKNKDLVHTLKNLFQHISARKMNESKKLDEDQSQNQVVEESSNSLSTDELSKSSSNESKDSYEKQTTFSTVPICSNEVSNAGTERTTTRVEAKLTEDEIRYDEDSKQMNYQFPPDHFHLKYSSDDYVRKKPPEKLTLKGVLLKLYNSIIDIISAILCCIDSAVTKFDSIKCDVSKECAALKNETVQLVNSIYFYLKLEEGVMNLFRYAKLQEKISAKPKLHRLKKSLCYGSNELRSADSKETYADSLKFKRFRRSPVLNQLDEKPESSELWKIRIWNDIESKFKMSETENGHPRNTHNEKRRFLSRLFDEDRKNVRRHKRAAEGEYKPWWQLSNPTWFGKWFNSQTNTESIQKESHENGRNTRRASPTISKSLLRVLLDVKQLDAHLRKHKMARRDVVYTWFNSQTNTESVQKESHENGQDTRRESPTISKSLLRVLLDVKQLDAHVRKHKMARRDVVYTWFNSQTNTESVQKESHENGQDTRRASPTISKSLLSVLLHVKQLDANLRKHKMARRDVVYTWFNSQTNTESVQKESHENGQNTRRASPTISKSLLSVLLHVKQIDVNLRKHKMARRDVVYTWFNSQTNTESVQKESHENGQNTRRESPTISKPLLRVLLDVKQLDANLRKHKMARRDVVYTYSDESTVDPDDQWYIDLAAREFVQGRDKNDPHYNRSKFVKNLKRSGIFSYGNFSQECLSNKTYPTDRPPTTWSRNFSIRYQPCTFWNWSRYLQVHSSYMDFLFGTGTPLTTRKRKRNLTAKRMRAHQDFLNRFSPKTTLKWPSSIWFNTTDWSEMESYADKVLKIKGNTDREPEDYFTMNSELRRISSIVWGQPEITEPAVRKRKRTPTAPEANATGGVKRKSKPDRPEDERSEETRVHRKRKKKPNGSGESRSKSEESDVYYDEMERQSTTEHIADWEYADRMFRHWKRIKD